MRYRPPTIREKGLRKHLGELKYRQFIYHYDYQMDTFGKVKIGDLSKATGISTTTLYEYVDIHRDELAREAEND